MVEIGANERRLVAKIAGGAQMFALASASEALQVGARNRESVLKCLALHKIPLLSEDCGLNYGRTVEFYSDNGNYLIKAVGKVEKII